MGSFGLLGVNFAVVFLGIFTWGAFFNFFFGKRGLRRVGGFAFFYFYFYVWCIWMGWMTDGRWDDVYYERGNAWMKMRRRGDDVQ